MFLDVIKKIFSTEDSQTNYFYYEDNNTPTKQRQEQEISAFQKQLTTPPKTNKIVDEHHHQQAFYDYLFGESSSEQAHDELSLYVANKINELISEPNQILSTLPALPASLGNMLTQLNNEEFDANLIINLIELEPAIAAKVIELANSAYYNKSEKEITDLKSAFMLLGVNGLIEGVLNGFVSQFTPQSQAYFRQYGSKIWQHSLSTANIAKQLILASNDKSSAATGYLIGLISNLGEMIIYQLLTQAFSYVHPDYQPNSLAFKELMISHAKRITYLTAKHWQFPPSILSALALQSKIHQASTLKTLFPQNPIACYIYEASMISELLIKYDHKLIDKDYLSQASELLIFSEQAKNYLSEHAQ
ncbi:HDOD domain-containing protein [Thalassotalea sp. G2M2-11]|uniref:HDOD domain-containing protein n=1 Tax=Thalassotalea sp. G2M2-11 TaxID=2787627 RepID=UPI0019D14FE2|nr:HDOD domain-containing protein [Thalassotalea sp. G2M2-11]